MSATKDKHEIAGCPVPPDLYAFIEGAAAANGMNVSTFTAWAMTRWAARAMERTAEHMGTNADVTGIAPGKDDK